MFSCIFASEIVPISQLNIYFMISFSFSEIQDLRSKCWSGYLSDSDLERLSQLCSFALDNVPFRVFKED